MLAYLSDLKFDNEELKKIEKYYKEVFESLGMTPLEIEDILLKEKIFCLESFEDEEDIAFSDYFESLLEDRVDKCFEHNCINLEAAVESYINNKNEKFTYSKSKEEEKYIFEKIRSGDKDARENFIIKNYCLVRLVVKSLRPFSDHLEDYYQDGYCGLIKAVDKFDPTKNLKFSTYAIPSIRNEIFRRNNKMNFAFNISEDVCILLSKYNEFLSEFQNRYGRRPNDLEIESFFGTSANNVKFLERSPYGISLDKILDDYHEPDIENIDDGSFTELIKTLDNDTRDENVRTILSEAKLTPIQRKMLETYFKTSMSYRDLGKLFGVSKTRVHQQITKSLKTLRETERVLELTEFLDEPEKGEKFIREEKVKKKLKKKQNNK